MRGEYYTLHKAEKEKEEEPRDLRVRGRQIGEKVVDRHHDGEGTLRTNGEEAAGAAVRFESHKANHVKLVILDLVMLYAFGHSSWDGFPELINAIQANREIG